jgi:hypothetical protein
MRNFFKEIYMKKIFALALATAASVTIAAGCLNGNFAAYAADGELWCCVGVGDGTAYSCTNGETWELYE